ncbi:MAG: hypothetical protein ACTHK4_12580 [Mycobacteriales bacterium]
MRRHATMGAGVALVAAAGLVGVSQVSAAPALPNSTVAPTLTARITGHGFTLTGDRSFPSNRVKVTLHAVGNERTLQILRFKAGYTLSDLHSDLTYFFKNGGDTGKPTQAAIRHLDHAIRHTSFYGGADAGAGKTATETVVLPAGRYTFLDDSGNLPRRPRIVHVPANPTGVAAPAPPTQAAQTMTTKRRFSGPTTLPASGTISITNHSTESPHQLFLQHVKKGTTRKQVERGFQSQKPPSFLLKGSAGADVLGKGKSQTLQYSLPKGTYAEFCFLPDPKTGVPHVFMGMIRMVHLS